MMAKAGVHPFGIRAGNHRGFHHDLHTKKAFGDLTPPLAPPALRLFTAKNLTSNTKHIVTKCNHFDANNGNKLAERIDNLTERDDRLAEALDSVLCQGSKLTGKACRWQEKPPESTEAKKERAKMSVLRRQMTMLRCSIDLRKKTNEMKIDRKKFLPPPTINECRTALKEQQKACESALKNAKPLQAQEQENKMTDAKSRGDKKEAIRELHNKLKKEECRDLFSENACLKKGHGEDTGLSRAQAPEDPNANPKALDKDFNPDDWETITEPTKTAMRTLQRNQKHFGQAHPTPFNQPPLSTDFNFKVASQAADGC